MSTVRLYLADDAALDAEARVLAVRDGAIACDRSCFYPGGGGQPCDIGHMRLPDGQTLAIVSVRGDDEGVLWHVADPAPPPAGEIVGQVVQLMVDRERRRALTRYHTVLHVLNTIALRDYGAWITGVQIAADYSRIDFKWDGFSAALRAELETKVNAVLTAGHPVASSWLAEDEFRRRDDLLRTLEARPPVADGRVRIVTIAGFDAQACGGTHVHSTAEIGHFSIVRSENKGKINKRLYIRLDPPPPPAG